MLRRLLITGAALGVLAATAVAAPGKIKQYGRATVEYRGDDVAMVANYDYSQQHHDGQWLLIDVGIQGSRPMVIHRTELTLVSPDGRTIPLATQQLFLADHEPITLLLQNATNSRHALDDYFSSRPAQRTVAFFSYPGGLVHDTVMTHLDEVVTGALLFKVPDGKWQEGTYRLVLNSEKARADLPITLR